MTDSDIAALRKRMADILTFAALPGAKRVEYVLEITADGESASLRSYTKDDTAIGDDRPYEILKARFEPLRSSVAAFHSATTAEEFSAGQMFTASLDLKNGLLDTSLNTGNGSKGNRT